MIDTGRVSPRPGVWVEWCCGSPSGPFAQPRHLFNLRQEMACSNPLNLTTLLIVDASRVEEVYPVIRKLVIDSEERPRIRADSWRRNREYQNGVCYGKLKHECTQRKAE